MAVFGIDVQIPDLLVATVIHAPMIGATLKWFDPSQALRSPGVSHVLQIPSGLAVVADTFWQAFRGAKAIKASWDEKTCLGVEFERFVGSLETLGGAVAAGFFGMTEIRFERSHAQTKSSRQLYELPFQAHACRGTNELHSTCSASPLRRVGAHPDTGDGTVHGSPYCSVAGFQGSRSHDLYGRSVRQARSRPGGRGGNHLQINRKTGKGCLEPRRGHAERFLSAGLVSSHEGLSQQQGTAGGVVPPNSWTADL